MNNTPIKQTTTANAPKNIIFTEETNDDVRFFLPFRGRALPFFFAIPKIFRSLSFVPDAKVDKSSMLYNTIFG